MATFASTTSPTPFGVFDDYTDFQTEADNMVVFVKRKLGDDVLSVELTKKMIWSSFEEATLEYGSILHQYQAKSTLLNYLGYSTGSDVQQKLPRQNLEYLDFSVDYDEFLNGGYVVSDGKDITIFASGSELNLAFDLKNRLNKYSVKIVSVPILNKLTPENALSLNSTKFTFTLELGKSIGWGDYIGDITESISIESFGSSAPKSDLSKYFKVDVESIEKRLKSYLI